MDRTLIEQVRQALGDAYDVEGELGGGGMSRVFVARERAFDRRVVIKVLSSETAAVVQTERFRREIALAARLQQANIVPVLAAGEVAGLPYYTMPFVEGLSLQARLAQGRPVSVTEVIGILREVARALAYAHERGIVHRDIKPGNVLVSAGTAMVTDFGIAKAITEATRDNLASLTGTGVAIGTPAYMAPEQATGVEVVDHRADLYAFGCLAYELLTGAPPFTGRPVHAVLLAHVTETPEPVQHRRADVPAPIAALIMQCLAKDPTQRPPRAIDVIAILDGITLPPGETRASRPVGSPRRWVTGGGLALVGFVVLLATQWRRAAEDAPLSIAVMPFDNTSRDTTIDYLEDGISDQVRDAVARLPGVAVKARSASRRFKGRAAGEAGQALRASLVLLGTVGRGRDGLHVTAELVRAESEDALWSGTFEVAVDAVGAVQDSMVQAISAQLRVQPLAGAAERGTTDAVAYDEFLRGRFEAERTQWEAALRHYLRAAARDPRFARAHANVAIAYSNQPTTGIGGMDTLNVLARARARQALALDSTLAEGHLALANALINELRFPEGIAAYKHAVTLNPSLADAHYSLAVALHLAGRVEEGAREAREALSLDTLSSAANGIMAYTWLLRGQPDSAIRVARRALMLTPDDILTSQALALALAFAGQRDSSAAQFERAYQLGPARFDSRANLVFAHVIAGRPEAALAARQALEQDASNSPNYRRAVADLALGRFAAAMDELARAVRAREPQLGNISVPCDPRFDPLKGDPRFADVMQRLGTVACPPTLRWPFLADHRR